jgi:alpha 1,2-mannosyltransferase
MLVKSIRRPSWPLLILPFTLLLFLSRNVHFLSDQELVFFHKSVQEHLHSVRLASFWNDLLHDLTVNKPAVAKLPHMDMPPNEFMDPNAELESERPKADFLKMRKSDVQIMQICHDNFVKASKHLASRVPYWKNTRGVVMTAGKSYIGVALTSIIMLRRATSALPVHLFIDTVADYDPHICEHIMPTLNAECLVMENLIGSAEVKKYQYKILSILFSPFQEVLYLDADAYPIHNPDHLFNEDPGNMAGLLARHCFPHLSRDLQTR